MKFCGFWADDSKSCSSTDSDVSRGKSNHQLWYYSANTLGNVSTQQAQTPVNDPPVAVADRVEVDEGGTVLLDASKLFANDTDVDSETLTMTKVGDGESGRVLLEGVTMPLLECGWAIPEPCEV